MPGAKIPRIFILFAKDSSNVPPKPNSFYRYLILSTARLKGRGWENTTVVSEVQVQFLWCLTSDMQLPIPAVWPCTDWPSAKLLQHFWYESAARKAPAITVVLLDNVHLTQKTARLPFCTRTARLDGKAHAGYDILKSDISDFFLQLQ